MSQTIMERLREETKSLHQQLEKATLPFIKRATNNEQYAALLQLFYGFFKPMEPLLEQHIDEHLIPDMTARRKAAALSEDLKGIGHSSSTELSHILPNIDDSASALGAMYVLEGSTLGGVHISKMLMRSLGKESMDGIRFFSGYGEATQPMWGAFTKSATAYADAHPAEADRIVEGANATFKAFMEWTSEFSYKHTPNATAIG